MRVRVKRNRLISPNLLLGQTLKLKLSGSKYATDTRDTFWREYCRQAELRFDDDGYSKSDSDSQYSPDRLEAMVRSRFVPCLNDALSYRFGRRGDGPGRMIVVSEASSTLCDIVLTLNRIEYNSLDLVLKVLGLDDGAILPLLCGALEVYASDAFQNAMPGNGVDLRVAAEFDGAWTGHNARKVSVPENTLNLPEAASSIKELARNRLWAILNGSLILPVILALVVLYQMAASVDRDHVEIINERSLLVQERGVILQSLAQQNAALVRILADRTETPTTGGSSRSPTQP